MIYVWTLVVILINGDAAFTVGPFESYEACVKAAQETQYLRMTYRRGNYDVDDSSDFRCFKVVK